MQVWRIGRAAQINAIAAAVLGGVAISRLWPEALWIVCGVVALVAVPLLGVRLGLLLVALLLTGWWRGNATMLVATPLGRYVGTTITATAQVGDDPSVSSFNNLTEVAFTASDVTLSGRSTHQSIKVYTAGYIELQRGYLVSFSGKLKTSKTTGALQMSYAKLSVLSTHTTPLERLRQRFFASMHTALPEPMSGFGLGLLIGVRALINKDLQETLNAVGLSHLIAVSGYNLTIIIQATRRITGRISHFTSTAISLWLMATFLLVTGFGASIVRASLVSGLSLLVTYYGYEIRPSTLLAVPAMLTVLWRPDYLIHDVGWQLSFLAFFGIIILAPLIEQRYVRTPNAIKSLTIESSAAQITTAPLIIALFGTVSLISPLSNLVILPLVPIAMLLSFMTGAAAMIGTLVGSWVGLPAAGLLALMIGVIQWFATWPHAATAIAIQTRYILLMYVLVGLFTFVLWLHNRRYHCASQI